VTTRGRETVIGLAAVAVALVVILTVIVAIERGPSSAVPPAQAAPSTSLAAAPSTAFGTTTQPPVPVPHSTAPEPSVAPRPVATHALIEGLGSALAPPGVQDIRSEDAPNDCASLADAGWQTLDCRIAQTPEGTLTYLIEALADPTHISTRAYVFRQIGGSEQVMLRADDDAGSRFDTSELEATVAPVGPGGSPVILVAFPRVDGSVSEIDIVDWPGVVGGDQQLIEGVVQTATGQLDTWSRQQAGSGGFVHDTIREDAGRWYIVDEEVVPAADVPPVSVLA